MLRTFGSYDVDAASFESRLNFDVEKCRDRADQSFKVECDIRELVRRFGLTGQMPPNFKMPQYGDFTGVSDFHTAMHVVVEAEQAFMELPAEMRRRFANDPQLLMEFLADEGNRDEAVKLGLVNKPEVTRTGEQVPPVA